MSHTGTEDGNNSVAALRNQWVKLCSNLLVHDMGPKPADSISQTRAGPTSFGPRHSVDSVTASSFCATAAHPNLEATIQAHWSGSARTRDASGANAVIGAFNTLPETSNQNLLNFLRSL